MSLLFRVIYAAHANGTHHKLALDALQRLARADADAWQRLFLKHVELYLEGSKAPDTKFKDFKNHVLHVREGYWGGAPEKVAGWYADLVKALERREWTQAVWCAGVLSHYYTDPIHPFHTAQSEAESNIHRAVEWSINRDYNNLKREAEVVSRTRLVEAPTGADWLKDFVCQGAEKANAHYERLIAHYDLNIGVVEPPAGLDLIARDLIGDLILYAADGFARVLERAIAESGATPPPVALTLDTVVATLKIPLKWVQKKLSDAEDRRVVEAMYDELMQTGRVERTLPEDDRTIKELHAREVLAGHRARQAQQRAQRLPSTAKTEMARPANLGAPAPATTGLTTPQQVAQAMSAPSNRQPGAELTTSTSTPAQTAAPAPATETPAPETKAPAPLSAPTHEDARTRPRIHLALTDDIERAPSIGPKTAERFYKIGISTVGEFLDGDAIAMAEQIDIRHIDPETIADWQDQAHLVMGVPGLRGGHAQLLVGAGYHTVASIAQADPAALSADILKFASTAQGQRILRDGSTPDIERIKNWVDGATAARAA